MSEVPSTEPAPQREGEDDYDLLTYGEAKVRLYEEIEAQRALVSRLTTEGGADGVLERAQRRLAALEEGSSRNSRQVINDDNFERFFGYKGTAHRNT
jgi:hypothetical protein